MDFTSSAVLFSGFILMLGGLVLAQLRSLPVQIFHYLASLFTSNLEVKNTDVFFYWLNVWLPDQPIRIANWKLGVSWQAEEQEKNYFTDEARSTARIELIPGNGVYYVRFEGRRVIVSRSSRTKSTSELVGSNTPSSSSGAIDESYQLRFFCRDKQHIQRFLHSIQEVVIRKNDFIHIYGIGLHSVAWNLLRSIRPRPLESTVLAKGVLDRLVDDMRVFMSRQPEYCKKSIPYRRGYLLFGEPGNGKTTTVLALASFFGLNVYILSLASLGMTDIGLMTILQTVQDSSVILIEDIDCLLNGREVKQPTSDSKEIFVPGSRLTFSGVLNALDGIGAKEGRIIFMTTNHREKLDAALIRPGRIDVQLEIGSPDSDQIRRLANRFYPDHSQEIEQIVSGLSGNKISMASIQGFFLRHEYSIEGVLANLVTFRNNPNHF